MASIDNGSCVFETATACAGDLNNDNVIDVVDLILFLGIYGTICE
jgi:hypothetical protein